MATTLQLGRPGWRFLIDEGYTRRSSVRGGFLAQSITRNPSVHKSNRLHVVIFWGTFLSTPLEYWVNLLKLWTSTGCFSDSSVTSYVPVGSPRSLMRRHEQEAWMQWPLVLQIQVQITRCFHPGFFSFVWPASNNIGKRESGDCLLSNTRLHPPSILQLTLQKNPRI